MFHGKGKILIAQENSYSEHKYFYNMQSIDQFVRVPLKGNAAAQ